MGTLTRPPREAREVRSTKEVNRVGVKSKPIVYSVKEVDNVSFYYKIWRKEGDVY